MHLVMASIALGAAVVGLAYSSLSARITRKPGLVADSRLFWSLFTWAVLLGIVLFAATLPTRPPFASGLGLGWGFLIGLALGLYATVEARRSSEDDRWLVRCAGLISAAVAGPALILIIFGQNAADALVGCALGAVLVAAIWRSGFAPMESGDDSGEEVSAYRGVETFALITVALVVGTRLALERYGLASGSIAGAYWALPALLGALIALGVVVLAGVAKSWTAANEYRRPLTVGLVVSIILIVGATLIGTKVLGDGLPGVVVVMGIVGFTLIAWLAVTTPSTNEEEMISASLGQTVVIGSVALAIGAVSFKLLHGFGESLALVGGIAFVGLMANEQRRQSGALASALVTGGFTVVLLLALYRLFLEKNAPAPALDFQQHYNYFGLVLGAVTGFALLAYVQRNCRIARQEYDPFIVLGRLVERTTILGVILAATPLLIVVIWGVKALSGFLVGLVVAEVVWLLLVGFVAGQKRQIALTAAPHLYLIAAFLVAIQFTQVVLPLAEGPRLHRGIIIAVTVLIALIWAVVSLVRAGEATEGSEGGE